MPWVKEPICHRCGRSLLHKANVCRSCWKQDFPLQQVRASLYYREPLAGVLHKMKYEGLFALAEPLAEMMVAAWPDWEPTPDEIVPIPLHQRRKRRRGFNQSSLLAIGVSDQVEISFNEQALMRTRHTVPQVDLSPARRLLNVRGAFTAVAHQVKGKQILLIDDVYTTGATMSAAADALIASGARGVSAYCLARTV
jgi:ComF family protein